MSLFSNAVAAEAVNSGEIEFFTQRDFQCRRESDDDLTCTQGVSGENFFIANDPKHLYEIREGLTYYHSTRTGAGIKWVGKIDIAGRQTLVRLFDTDADGELDANGGGWLEVFETGANNQVVTTKTFVGVFPYFSKVFDKANYTDESPRATDAEMDIIRAANAAYQQSLEAAGF